MHIRKGGNKKKGRRTLIIDTPDLRKYTTLSEFKDVDKLKGVIQDIDYFAVQKLLGLPLYNHLLTGELGEHQTTLKELVNRYAGILVAYDVILDSVFRTADKGNISDSQSSEVDLIKYKRQDLNSKTEQMKADILGYIDANKDSFKDFWNFIETSKSSSKYYSAILFN